MNTILGVIIGALLISLWRTAACGRRALDRERRARLDAEKFARSLEDELFLVRGMSDAAFGERTSAAVRRLVVKARGVEARKVWS